jgi:hypothetical protein
MDREANWLPSGRAASALGVSIDTLKRYADRDAFLIEGKHWRSGAFSNSPRLWNVPLCLDAITKRQTTFYPIRKR